MRIVPGDARHYTPLVPPLLTDFDAILLDLDGTIYHEEHALPGAIELIRRLQQDRRRFACLTNSTSSPARLAARLLRMGVAVPTKCIYTAGAAAVDYVLSRWPGRPRVYHLGTDGSHDLLEGKVHWVQHAAEPCDVVLVGTPMSVYATEERQRVALDLLRGRRCHVTLLGMCADRVYPSPRGIEFGCGALTAMLAYAADVKPVFTGKPERVFFEELCHRMGVPAERCVLVGDNLESDIAGARAVGMTTILVLTGVSRREDVERAAADKRPHAIIEDLTQFG